MVGGLDSMVNFITLAPYFIVGAFLSIFIFVKIAQSELLYRWMSDKIEVRRAKAVRQIRQEMMLDLAAFLRKRSEQELSPQERKIYYRMLEYYYARIERLYGGEKSITKDDKERR